MSVSRALSDTGTRLERVETERIQENEQSNLLILILVGWFNDWREVTRLASRELKNGSVRVIAKRVIVKLVLDIVKLICVNSAPFVRSDFRYIRNFILADGTFPDNPNSTYR